MNDQNNEDGVGNHCDFDIAGFYGIDVSGNTDTSRAELRTADRFGVQRVSYHAARADAAWPAV